MTRTSRRRAVFGLGTAFFGVVPSRPMFTQSAAPEVEANKAVVSRLFNEVYNRGDLDALGELFSPDFIGDDPSSTPGIAAYKETQAAVRAQYERYLRAFTWEMTDVAAD